MQTPSFLWITDPWSTLDHSKDTTLRLMQEAIKMGIPTFWTASDILFSGEFPDMVMTADFSNGIPNSFESFRFQPTSLSRFQQIHDRIDPPVDDHYCAILDGLIQRGAREEQILNPPSMLKFQSEKIPPTELMHFAPKMTIVEKEADAFQAEILFKSDSEIVSKPLNLAQSVGVMKHPTPQSMEEWNQLCSTLTSGYSQKVLIEEYLPQIHDGETRLWFAGDHFIGALKKYPKKADFRVLIDEGSKVEAHELTDMEKEMAKEIGASLKNHGVLMAAIDLIGNKICDFNITSPGLLMQLEKVHGGRNFTKEVLIQALRFHESQDHE